MYFLVTTISAVMSLGLVTFSGKYECFPLPASYVSSKFLSNSQTQDQDILRRRNAPSFDETRRQIFIVSAKPSQKVSPDS